MIRGDTTNARCPASASSRMTSQARSSHLGFSTVGTTIDATFCRSPGISRSSETSRSPKTVMAMVRGMGVAVITSTCGVMPSRPRSRRRSRCRTPNRCCSSMTTSPRSKNSTPSLSSACVPTTIPATPDTASSSAWRFSPTDIEPVSNVTWTSRPASSSKSRIVRACCAARTSVGASRTDCRPASTTCSIPSNATTVLPEPTSPCSSRFMGAPPDRSADKSRSTERWPPVSSKGSDAVSRSDSPAGVGGHCGATRSASPARRRARASWSSSASSYLSRSRARAGPSAPGKCASRRATSNVGRCDGNCGSGSFCFGSHVSTRRTYSAMRIPDSPLRPRWMGRYGRASSPRSSAMPSAPSMSFFNLPVAAPGCPSAPMTRTSALFSCG